DFDPVSDDDDEDKRLARNDRRFGDAEERTVRSSASGLIKFNVARSRAAKIVALATSGKRNVPVSAAVVSPILETRSNPVVPPMEDPMMDTLWMMDCLNQVLDLIMHLWNQQTVVQSNVMSRALIVTFEP
ncbi:unnamed protein product, partial [Cyprideis torosa]